MLGSSFLRLHLQALSIVLLSDVKIDLLEAQLLSIPLDKTGKLWLN